MLHKKIDLLISKISSILFLLLAISLPANASDIQIEGYITGGVSISLNGDYQNGIIFDQIFYPPTETSTQWLANKNVDYIDFVDDTTTQGFYLTMSITDFHYTGNSQTQGPLSIDHMSIIGKLNGATPAAATKGYDDPDYNLSILPNSCQDATADKFTFHDDLMSSNTNYTLIPSNTSQTILTSTSPCLAIGHLRLDKMKLTYPAETAVGLYSATIVYTIIDGSP